MAEPKVRLVKSAQRVLEVLEYFDLDHPTATVMDISRALSFPQSSTSVLLQCLRRLGYLHYNPYKRTYRPTARVALLGCRSQGGIFHGGKVLAMLDAIESRLGQTVVLSSSWIDYALHHLHVVQGTTQHAAAIHAGQTEPLLHSAQGELLLASYPDQQIRSALHRLNSEEQNPERRVNINAKQKELQAIRQRGWNIRHDLSAGQHGSVAVLMPRQKGQDRIVLSVVADRNLIEQRSEEFLHTVLQERDRFFPSKQEDNPGGIFGAETTENGASVADPLSMTGF